MPEYEVEVEVKFTVKIDVTAPTENEAGNLACDQQEKKYGDMLKNSMAGSPKEIYAEATWVDQYEDSI